MGEWEDAGEHSTTVIQNIQIVNKGLCNQSLLLNHDTPLRGKSRSFSKIEEVLFQKVNRLLSFINCRRMVEITIDAIGS